MNAPHLDPYTGHASTRLFQVCFYELHEGKAPLTAHNQANVHVLYALVLFIREEYDEDSSGIAVCV